MLKRAVFGITGPPNTPRRRRKSKASETLPSGRSASPPCKSRKTTVSRRRENEEMDSNEDSDLFEEVDTSDAESLSDKCDESGGESNPPEDPKVRRALIRRAAALYAEDSRRFLQAMRKHETGGGETDSEDDPELLDLESDNSVTEKTSRQATKGRRMDIHEKDDKKADDDRGFKRGKFHCKLCPKKVFIFESDLEKHLESRVHKRREARWEKQQPQDIGCEGCELNELKTDTAQVTPSDNPAKRRSERKKGGRKGRIKSRRSERRKDVESLTAEEIQARKEKFRRKKQRRQERRAAASNS